MRFPICVVKPHPARTIERQAIHGKRGGHPLPSQVDLHSASLVNVGPHFGRERSAEVGEVEL